MPTIKEIETKKYNRLVAEFKQKPQINDEDIKIFIIDYYNKNIVNNLPTSIEILIILVIDEKMSNLPITLKKIILSNAYYEKYIDKIPFGCELIIFDEKQHYNEYLENIAFQMFITKTNNLKVKNLISSFSDNDNNNYYYKYSLSTVRGIWSANKILVGKELSTPTNISYIQNRIQRYKLTM